MQAIGRQPYPAIRVPDGAPVHYERHVPNQENRSHAKHSTDPSASASMIIPTIQSDEWLEGYRGRLSRLSDISTRFGVEPALRNLMAYGRDDIERPLSFIGMLSKKLAMPVSDIVLRHTLWPAQIAVDRTSDHDFIARQAADIDGKFVFSRQKAAVEPNDCSVCDLPGALGQKRCV